MTTSTARRTRCAATTATAATTSPSHTTTTLGRHMKKKQKRKMRRMDAKDGQPQEVFIAQSKGKPGKTRGSPGGAIIASKTKLTGHYDFQGKMPSHGQHYLQGTSNLACFPYKPWKPNM